jgi:hypothetical protein
MQENTLFLLQKSARMGPSFKVSMRHNFQTDVLNCRMAAIAAASMKARGRKLLLRLRAKE